MSSFSVVIPAYQEAQNLKTILPQLVDTISRFAGPWEILIVDTMEPMDDTAEVCGRHEGVRVVTRRGGNFYGNAITTGIQEAKYEKIIIMDADGSHSPSYLPDMAGLSEKYDLVIGSRYVRGGSTENPPILIFMSYVVNVAYRLVLRIPISDISNSFRIYNAGMLKQLDLQSLNFDIVEEILIKMIVHHPGIKIIETPVRFNKRLYGTSKRELFKFALSYGFSLMHLLKFKRRARN